MSALMHVGEIGILHVLNGEQYSGLERVVDHLAEFAPRYGFRLHLVCLKPGDLPDRISTREARFHHVRMRGRLDLSGLLAIRRIAIDQRCRLIHSHTVRSAVVVRALRILIQMPWVHQVHSPALHESENNLLNRINYLVERTVLPKADVLLPVSHALRTYVEMRYHIDRSRSTVIPNGVESVEVSLAPRRPRTGAGCIGMVGLFRPRKGVEVLLDALVYLRNRGVTPRLKLVGGFVSDHYARSVMLRITSLSLECQVELTGYRYDIRPHIAGLDVFVMPSLFGEGMPMALLEAMAMGRLIVASRVDGIVEPLAGGACGILVEPGNAAALADAIYEAMGFGVTGVAASDTGKYEMDVQHAALAEAARERQRSLYSVDMMARGIFGVYMQQLGLSGTFVERSGTFIKRQSM